MMRKRATRATPPPEAAPIILETWGRMRICRRFLRAATLIMKTGIKSPTDQMKRLALQSIF